MLYDDQQMSQREGLYTVIGALVLAVVLFILLATQLRQDRQVTTVATHPLLMPQWIQTSKANGWRRKRKQVAA